VERNSETILYVKNYINDLILVTEQEIADAISFAWNYYDEEIVGSATTA